MKIDQQSSKDLEFDKIRNLLSDYCKSDKAKVNAEKISFFDSLNQLQDEFNLVEEIQNVYHDDTLSFPHPNAEDIDDALKMLRIDNGVLILDELLKIFDLCIGTKDLIRFAKSNKVQYPLIFKSSEHITKINDVLNIITKILDTKLLKIKDGATVNLNRIRSNTQSVHRESNKQFGNALNRCRKESYLGDIEETHMGSRRLLAVLSQYKKQVKGKVHGISAKGNFTYIEPQEVVDANNSLDQLVIEERHEIYLILEAVTNELRGEQQNLKAFQRLLIKFDLLNAKVLFANSYDGVKPIINKTKKVFWKNAKHPLLFLTNQKEGVQTIGQDIEMDPDQRFLVISGPNAGGKSITLKTVGLLQMMFQSGLFLPFESGSSSCWFSQVLSDIGDNQSIENQLSTYSYRLNRMQFFLTEIKEDALLLLDEFGSGSDPELGGALAEVFYQELYKKDIFAVITTHYTSIKILTSTLSEAVNACMLFDTKKLQPLYQLSVGQPGSSFTFEVAEKNGISNYIIDEAKKRVSENKLRIDELTVELQVEKSKYKKINKDQIKNTNTAKKRIVEFDNKLSDLTDKANKQIQYFEQQNKFVNTGKKVYELIKKFKNHKTNKALFEAVKKMVAIEKTKVIGKTQPVELNQGLKLPKLPPTVKKSEKTIVKEAIAIQKEIKIKKLKTGDMVKLKNHSGGAVVQEINGNKIKVLVGNFIISTSITEIERYL